MASAATIARYGYTAGWRGPDLVVAVAVALAESGGVENKLGDVALQTEKWGPSVGLWQIRSVKAEKGRGTQRDESANVNGQTNATNAYAIWKAQGWGPWSAHTNKSYLLYMPVATSGVTDFLAVNPGAQVGSVIDAVPGSSAVQDAADNALNIAKEPIRVLKWLQQPGTQIRIAKVMVGGALVVVALRIVVSPAVNDVVAKVSAVKGI